jgi:hypothetical protein
MIGIEARQSGKYDEFNDIPKKYNNGIVVLPLQEVGPSDERLW